MMLKLNYNVLNFQESTTILNACPKKSGNLLNVPHVAAAALTGVGAGEGDELGDEEAG